MRKVFLFMLLVLSSTTFAQREKLIGSWIPQNMTALDEYVIETFYANGNYRVDMFVKQEGYLFQLGTPNAGKWSLDSDNVLCVYGTIMPLSLLYY